MYLVQQTETGRAGSLFSTDPTRSKQIRRMGGREGVYHTLPLTLGRDGKGALFVSRPGSCTVQQTERDGALFNRQGRSTVCSAYRQG